MKICFLGGTFDPPHIGHLKIALECLKQCDKFIFIPSKQSPHKISQPYFSSHHRLAMLNMLASNYDNIAVDPFEINSIDEISYTINTVRYLTEKYNNEDICMVVGSDLISNIESWKKWNEINDKVSVICFSRIGYEDVSFKDKKFIFLDSVNLDVSSSFIKKEMISNNSYSFANFSSMISKEVYNYICDNKLHRKSL